MFKEKLDYFLTKDISFQQLVEEWLLYKKHRVKVSTFCRYQYDIHTYLEPLFQAYCLKDFRFFDLQNLVENLIQNLSCKSVRDILCIFKSILKLAEEKHHYSLYLQPYATPQKAQQKIHILSQEEKRKLENACFERHTLKSLGILLCLHTGMRLGEICALQWKNIHLANANIEIESTLQRVYLEKGKTSILISSAKTFHSLRTIPLSSKLVTLLQDLEPPSPDAFFLTSTTNQYVEPRNLQYYFHKLLQESNLPPYNFHILRHTFATNCIQVGMDSKSLSELLGHSNVEITLNKYVHFSSEMAQKYLEML